MALSWSLRERGVEDFVCGKIDTLAREFGGVARAAQQDPSPLVEAAPNASIAAPEAEDGTPTEAVTPFAPERTPAELRPDARLAALSWLDRLPLVDRFALFA